MSTSEGPIDLRNANDVRTLLVSIVGEGMTVLHVGRGQWDVAEALVGQQCRVSGVDARAAESSSPPTWLDSMVSADLDSQPLSVHFKPESFDVIIFDEVLNDLRDPVEAVRDAAAVLVAGGRLLVSIHNGAHGSARLALLQGRPSTPPGLTEGTDARRSFTHETLCDLLDEAGLVVESLHATVRDPLDAGARADPEHLPALVVEWVRHQPDALHHRYVAVTRTSTDSTTPGPRPRVRSAVALSTVRRTDKHTERMLADQQERHRMLTLRDHVLGLEAIAATARVRVTEATTRERKAVRRMKRLRTERDALTAAIERMASSPLRPSRADIRRLLDLARARSYGSGPVP